MTDAELTESKVSAERATRDFRRWALLIVLFVAAIGVVAFVAFDARAGVSRETTDRVDAVVAVSKGGCENTNRLARAVKDILASQGTVLVPADAADLGFTDPAVTAYVQALIDRSQGSAAKLKAQGEGIRILDCAALAHRSG